MQKMETPRVGAAISEAVLATKQELSESNTPHRDLQSLYRRRPQVGEWVRLSLLRCGGRSA
jgi:hypothetical protein